MILGWEVNDVWWKQALVEKGHARLNLFAFASLHVIIKHFRKALFELQSNSFPHDADAVDGVYERLCCRSQNIRYQNFHIVFLKNISFRMRMDNAVTNA